MAARRGPPCRERIKTIMYENTPTPAICRCASQKEPKVPQHSYYADRLVAALSQPGLPNRLPTSQISRAIGAPWRHLGSRLLARRGVALALGVLGWSYAPARGRLGGHFVRVHPARVQEVQEALGLPWTSIAQALLWGPWVIG